MTNGKKKAANSYSPVHNNDIVVNGWEKRRPFKKYDFKKEKNALDESQICICEESVH